MSGYERSCANRWLAEGTAVSPSYQFAFEDCLVLVLYALVDDEVEPDERTPAFVAGPEAWLPLSADSAPYLTVLDREDFAGELEGVTEDGQPHDTSVLADLRGWLATRPEAWIGYQLEPAAIAGLGTARRLGLALE